MCLPLRIRRERDLQSISYDWRLIRNLTPLFIKHMINQQSDFEGEIPEFISTLLVYEILMSKHQEPKLNNLAIQSIHNLLPHLNSTQNAISLEQQIRFKQLKVMTAHEQLTKFYHLADTIKIIRPAVLRRIRDDACKPRCLMMYEEEQLFKSRYRNRSPANLRKSKKQRSLHTDSTSKNSSVKIYHEFLPYFSESKESSTLDLQKVEQELARVIGQGHANRNRISSTSICFNIKDKFCIRATTVKARQKKFQKMLRKANISPIEGSQQDRSGQTLVEYYGIKKTAKKSANKLHKQSLMNSGQLSKFSKASKSARRRSAEISRRSSPQSVLNSLTPKPKNCIFSSAAEQKLAVRSQVDTRKQKLKILPGSRQKPLLSSKQRILTSSKQGSKKRISMPQKGRRAKKR